MTEELVIISDCKPVKDRLMQDPAIQYQNEYFMERAKEFGFDPSETSVLGTNATSTTSPSDQVIVNIPVGSSSSNSGQGYQLNRVVVYPGGTVIWSNQDNAFHSATSGNPGSLQTVSLTEVLLLARINKAGR